MTNGLDPEEIRRKRKERQEKRERMLDIDNEVPKREVEINESFLSSETTDKMWKSWLNYLECKGIKEEEADINCCFYRKGKFQRKESWFNRQYDTFKETILEIQAILVNNPGRVGDIVITSGIDPDCDEILHLANTKDLKRAGIEEHIVVGKEEAPNA